MPHIERDLEYFQFPCLLFLFQVQNLLLSSPYLFLDLLNFQPVLSQFVLFVTLLFFLILLALSCVGVFVRANLTFFFVFRLFLGPMVLVLDTFMFQANFFYLFFRTLPQKMYHWASSVSVGWFIFQVLFFVSSSPSSFSTTKIFFNIGFATSPRSGTAVDATSPIENPFPLSFFSSHSNKSSSV